MVKTKRFLGIIITLTMLIGMLAIAVSATDTPELKWGTSKDNLTGSGSLSGLGWKGAAYIQLQRDITYSDYGVSSDNAVTLDLNGYTLTINGGDYGLYVSTGDLKITDSSTAGNGSLIVTAGRDNNSDYGVYVKNGNIIVERGSVSGKVGGKGCHGVYAVNGNITVTGGSLSGITSDGTSSKPSYGVYASYGSITVSGGILTGSGDSGVYAKTNIAVSGTGSLTGEGIGYGVDSDGSITVEGGSLTGKTTATYGTAVIASNIITVSGGSLTATSNERGIYSSDITVTDEGILSGTGINRYGVYASDTIIVEENSSLTGEGANYGVYATNDITVSGGSLTGTATAADSRGVRVGGIITVTGEGTLTGTGATAVYIGDENGSSYAEYSITTDAAGITTAVLVEESKPPVATVITADNVATNYTDITLAVKDAMLSTGSTLKLSGDLSTDTYVTIEMGSFTIDLNGQTWESSSCLMYIGGSADIKITDSTTEGTGKLLSTSINASVIMIYGSAELEVTGGTLENSGSYYAINSYKLSQVIVSGGNVVSSNNSAIFASGSLVKVTDGTITGSEIDIEYNAGTIDLSDYNAPTGVTICSVTNTEVTVSDATIKLPVGYGMIDNGGNAVTILEYYCVYTVGKIYPVTINSSTNGTVTADKAVAAEGETVTLTVTPESGYVLRSLTVMQDTTSVEFTDYLFTMPNGEVTVTAVFSETIEYIDADGTEKNCIDFTIVTSDMTEWSEGWYVVKDNVIIDTNVTMDGNIHLILCDGASLTVGHSTHDPYAQPTIYDGDLTIYSQINGTGILTVIGKEKGICNNRLIINGGNVTVEGGVFAHGGDYMKADGIVAINGVTVNGGSLTAIGGNGVVGKVTINGGTVEAIASGESNDGIYGNVTITDGTLTVTGSNEGGDAIYGDLTITGGTVKAIGRYGGNGVVGKVTMNGGNLEAIGSKYMDQWEIFGALEHAPVLNGAFDVITENFDGDTVPYDPAAIADYKVFKAQPGIAHQINLPAVNGGTVTSNYTEQAVGWKITLTVTPDDNYVMESLTVDGTDVTAQVTNKTYSFTMPASDVTVTAVFAYCDNNVDEDGNHKCDICDTYISELHDDRDNDHLCDVCDYVMSECEDINPTDHVCDICKKTLGGCEDTNPADHICDICKKTLGGCEDTNPADHICDICKKTLSECEDINPVDHVCDICKKTLSECEDINPVDHVCDICKKTLSECEDTNPVDHVCDICKEYIDELHADEDDNHLCDVCDYVMSECDFDTNNGFCSVCGEIDVPELKDNYYQIENAGQFYWFANHINTVDRTANAVLVADIDLEGKTDGTGRKWTPIGSTGENNNNFRGHFDGRNHTITNLYIDMQRAGIGLFGEVRLGTVENFTIYGDVKLYGDCSYVGGVIGSAPGANGTDVPDHNGATIRNITSYVNVTLVENAHGSSFVGGFIGYANHETIIENCSWYGTFDLGAYRADSGVGGLVGRLYDGSDVTIRNCGAYGTIKTSYKSGTHNNYDTIYIGGVLSFSPSGTQAVLKNNLWAGEFINETDLGAKAHLSAFGTLNGGETVKNCYTINSVPYITTENANANGITDVTAQRLASGEVAYKLGEAWGQDLSKENSLPVLGGEKVYLDSENGTYYNEEKVIYGDFNGDSDVGVSDVILMLQHIALANEITVAQQQAGDVDCNGSVDVSDAIRTLQHIANNSIVLGPQA